MVQAAVKCHQTASHWGNQSRWLAMSVPWTIPCSSKERLNLYIVKQSLTVV